MADDIELIPDDTPVSVSGFVELDPNGVESLEDRRGVILSGGHTVDGVPHYDVRFDDGATALIATDRITVE